MDQAQSLHNPEAQLPNDNAGFPMPQQLVDLTLAEVKDFVPVVAPVLIPIFGALGLLHYPTKPISMAVQVATVSICTYLQRSPPIGYEYAVRDLLSSEVPQAYTYTTIRTEQQADGNLMGVIRARTRKASVLPREYGPVNWDNAPLDLDGKSLRFPWQIEILRKIITASLRASPHSRSNYSFKVIQIPNRYLKEPLGYYRARPIARGQENSDHQLQHLDFARIQKRIEVAAQVRRRNLSRRMVPLQYEPARHRQGKMTMSGELPLVLLEIVNSVLGLELRAEWDDECLNLEINNFEIWKRACGL